MYNLNKVGAALAICVASALAFPSAEAFAGGAADGAVARSVTRPAMQPPSTAYSQGPTGVALSFYTGGEHAPDWRSDRPRPTPPRGPHRR